MIELINMFSSKKHFQFQESISYAAQYTDFLSIYFVNINIRKSRNSFNLKNIYFENDFFKCCIKTFDPKKLNIQSRKGYKIRKAIVLKVNPQLKCNLSAN